MAAKQALMRLQHLKTEFFPKLFPLLPSAWTADANAIRAQKLKNTGPLAKYMR